MKIAVLGTRGIPARYGGFETCAEEISVRLIDKGHQVTVYCREGNAPDAGTRYRGAELVTLPCLKAKALETFSHTAISTFHALFRPYDAVLVFNAANSPLCTFLRLAGRKVALNVDGLEWKRRKWGAVARNYYQLAEYISTKVANVIISDSRGIASYYIDRYKTPSTFIAYGANIEGSQNPAVLQEYGLTAGSYFFVGSRLEPENNADLTVAAFERVQTDKKLVIAGGANYRSPFIENLRRTTDPRIQFLGPVYKDGHMRELHCNCYAYVHGNEVGGTNPALLKALGYGNCVLSLNVIFNKEVIADAGIMYERDVEDLRQKLQFIVDNPDVADRLRQAAVQRILQEYTWEKIADEYERMLLAL